MQLASVFGLSDVWVLIVARVGMGELELLPPGSAIAGGSADVPCSVIVGDSSADPMGTTSSDVLEQLMVLLVTLRLFGLLISLLAHFGV